MRALSFINSYFKKFPEIKDYMNRTIKTCRKQGFVTNIFGRRIHLRELMIKILVFAHFGKSSN